MEKKANYRNIQFAKKETQGAFKRMRRCLTSYFLKMACKFKPYRDIMFCISAWQKSKNVITHFVETLQVVGRSAEWNKWRQQTLPQEHMNIHSGQNSNPPCRQLPCRYACTHMKWRTCNFVRNSRRLKDYKSQKKGKESKSPFIVTTTHSYNRILYSSKKILQGSSMCPDMESLFKYINKCKKQGTK